MNFEKRKTPMLPKLTPLGYPTVMVQSSHKSYMHTHYWVVSIYCDDIASPPITIWFNTVKKQNLLGFDGFSLTLSSSSDRHFQTNKAIDLGLVLFWSSLVVLCVSMKKSIMEASSDHIFIQTFTSISISPIFFFIYHLNILWKWIIGIMDIFYE